MLSENLKNLRKSKGISQEELSIRLNVVRQTISKWEKGLSVPDAELLIRIADELDTSVNVLLGESVPQQEDNELKNLSMRLEIINEKLAEKSEKHRKTWRTFFIVVCVIIVCIILNETVALIYHYSIMKTMNEDISVIGGYDGPTNIYVSKMSFRTSALITYIAISAASIIGIFKTGKK